jgi:moderate conductance mechanosensitive channel
MALHPARENRVKLKPAGTGRSAASPATNWKGIQMNFDINAYLEKLGGWFYERKEDGIQILLIIVLTFVLLKVATFATKKISSVLQRKDADIEYAKRSGTLSGVIHWILRVVILAVAAFMLLEKLGVPVAPILTAAGVVGLAVGFGAQNLVQDFISGFFILLEDQVRVGDVVQIGDKGGLVEKITLRMVILRDLAGTVHFIRNGKIDVVSNMTKDYSNYVFTIGVAYRENVDEVIKVLKGIDEEMRQDAEYKNDILAPLEVMGLDSFGDSSINIKARTRTKPIQQWRVGREFNRRIKQKFDELNIEIPFPHRTIYFGKDKAGGSPPLNVEMKQTT